MEYTRLKDVNASSQQWTVRARVVRFCRYLSPDDPSKIRQLDLVLLDEEGTAMNGQIPETWVPSFLSKLTEGFVYYIKYFQVRNARELYRPVDHPYLMRFTAHTKVYEIKPIPPQFPKYAYNLATFQVLNTRINETAYCSDVIGVLKECSHVKLQNTSKGTKPLRNVHIINDNGETAVVALWGNHANEFEAEQYIEMSNHGPVVFLFVGVTCRRFDGKLSLQGSTLCRWYANPEIPEAMTLHNSCVGRTAPATWYGPTAGQAAPERKTVKYLRNITNNFSDERILDKGGFGTVYKGVLQNGEMIAVKRLNSSMPGVGDRQFENEANHLMRFKHPNVVLLVGWCSETENTYVEYNGKYVWAERSETLLCLEYMPKGNLRGYLSDEFSGLGWDTRYKIIEGICYGLRYLHEECQINTPIVHMDLKPSNILLDNNMVPKIADFGLSRLFGEEKTSTCTRSNYGTLGYMSPEYIHKGLISTKSDIFSLGVIIIEIVTGGRDYPDETGTSPEVFIEKVLDNWTKRNPVDLLFGHVSLQVDCQQIRRCIQIGLDCVNIDRSKRPTISQIIQTLHGLESADSSNIKGVHRPQSGKRERNCGETSWMERLAKKHAPGFSTDETSTGACRKWA